MSDFDDFIEEVGKKVRNTSPIVERVKRAIDPRKIVRTRVLPSLTTDQATLVALEKARLNKPMPEGTPTIVGTNGEPIQGDDFLDHLKLPTYELARQLAEGVWEGHSAARPGTIIEVDRENEGHVFPYLMSAHNTLARARNFAINTGNSVVPGVEKEFVNQNALDEHAASCGTVPVLSDAALDKHYETCRGATPGGSTCLSNTECPLNPYLRDGGRIKEVRSRQAPYETTYEPVESENRGEKLTSRRLPDYIDGNKKVKGEPLTRQRAAEPYGPQCEANEECPFHSHLENCTLESGGHSNNCALTKNGRLSVRKVAGKILGHFLGPVRTFRDTNLSALDEYAAPQPLDPERVKIVRFGDLERSLGGQKETKNFFNNEVRHHYDEIRHKLAKGESLLPDPAKAEKIVNTFIKPQSDTASSQNSEMLIDPEDFFTEFEPPSKPETTEKKKTVELPPTFSSRYSSGEEEFDRLMNFRIFNSSTRLACANCGCEVERPGFCKMCTQTDEQATQSIIDSVGTRDVARDLWGITPKPDMQTTQVEPVNPGTGTEQVKPVR